MADYSPVIRAKFKMKITKEDRERYKYHTDAAIINIKIIKEIPDKKLMSILKSKAQLEKLRLKIGDDTNPNWVSGQVAEELYDRELIDEIELDFYNR